jgi:hypothetical protein
VTPCPHLDVRSRVDLVHGVAGRPARLPVQVVALDEHRVVAKATHPHVALAAALQLHATPDVKPAHRGRGLVTSPQGEGLRDLTTGEGLTDVTTGGGA